MRGKIKKSSVDALKPGESLSDTEIKGFVVRRLRSGTLTYGYRYRQGGRQRWLRLGLHGNRTPDEARKAAKRAAGQVANERDPAGDRETMRQRDVTTVDLVLDQYLDRQVRPNLHSAGEIERAFNKYVRRRIGSTSIYQLRRSDVASMLDEIEDDHGSVMADRTLAYLRKGLNWWAARDDDFNPPIVAGMARTNPAERARVRVLDDDEIRDLWVAVDSPKVPERYRGIVKVLLLTAQRRNDVAKMRWEHIKDDVWTLPFIPRKKKNAKVVPLSALALQLIGTSKAKGYVFASGDGSKPFSGFSKAKRALDQAISGLRQSEGRQAVPPWKLHDLRRTARSLMSRSGVSPDIGERVLGHAIPGIRGVYDRHSFLDEKRDALQKLSLLLAEIVNN